MESKKWTAEEILELIKNLDNTERWTLLDKMYDEYYNPRSGKEVRGS